MNRILRILAVMFALFTVQMLGLSGVSAQGNSAVRFMHAIPNTAPVDVYINGTLVAVNLSYGNATGYIQVPAGNHVVAVTPTGIATVLWQQDFAAAAGSPVTMIAAEAGSFSAFTDNLNATAFGGSRLLLIHALAGGPAVDVQLAEPVTLNGVEQSAGTVIAPAVAYGNSFGAFDLPAQTYVVNVLPSGGSAFSTLLGSVPLTLHSGTSNMAVVYGSATSPQAALLSAATTAGAGDGFVRLVHGVVSAPAVDVFLNETLVISGLTIDRPSDHIAVPAGSYKLSVRLAGAETEVVATDVTVEAGTAQTVSILGAAGGFIVAAQNDDLSNLNESTAVVSVFNTIEGATVSVALADGTDLGSGVAFSKGAPAVALAPTRSGLSFTLTLGDNSGTLSIPETTFYGGVYYNIIVLDGDAFSAPSLLIAPTTLAQTLASAPGAGNTTLVVNQPASEVSNEPSTSSETVQQQATPAPVQGGIPANAVTAEVILDPSANLQLRQYPNAEALSLGLAPSGSRLEVNGREGRPVALVEGQEPPAEAAEWVDPVTLLPDEDTDLDPATTWLNVTYYTPDGGEINAWVLSQFLLVREPDGDRQRIADLPTVGGNIPGEARNTQISSPRAPEDRTVAVVININATANLNLRRTPTTDGEVLAQLPLETVVDIVGLIDVEEGVEFIPAEAVWAFVNYSPASGGVISGWVSTGFLRYEWNNRTITLDELFQRGLISRVAPDTIGRISATTAQISAPTPDPRRDAYVAEVILDASANLQFRRNPDAQSESLNLIPAGTFLIVDLRSPDNLWLRAEFEGQTGWISSQYVALTFNGRQAELAEVPLDVTLPTPVPTLVPTPGS